MIFGANFGPVAAKLPTTRKHGIVPVMSDLPSLLDLEPRRSGGSVEPLELLADLGTDFAASQDISQTIRLALLRITEYLDAAGGALFLLEEDGQILRCEACVGVTQIAGIRLPSDHGIVGRSVTRNAGEIVSDVSKDPDFNDTVDTTTGHQTRSILCAPLSVKDECIGAIELIDKRGGERLFDSRDFTILQALSAAAALAILNAKMAADLIEKERVGRELELAAEIQRSLLPAEPADDLPIRGINRPARTVSGDFYDYFQLPDGRICFAVGDVSGKGMTAALLMAKTASLFRCLGKTIHDPGELLSRINAEIVETATRGMFVTMAAGLYDPASSRIRIANAGHEPALVRDEAGKYAEIDAGAPPLGVVRDLAPGSTVPVREFNLDGGTLYIFTDGVTESSGADGRHIEVSGFRELADHMNDLRLKERLPAMVDRIAGSQKVLHDDITLLAIQASGNDADRHVTKQPILKLQFTARAASLKSVRENVRDALATYGCPAGTATDIVVAVDEACQNIIRHGYGGDSDREIDLEILAENDSLVFLLRDAAEPVDINKIVSRPLDELRPGGLGTHFMREIMDEIDFDPLGSASGNLLKMRKRIG
jgi:sigma-B regulation protein RsbU (phosphoserine phosphatase)